MPHPLPLPLPGPSRAETTTRCMIKELLDTAIIADWKGPLFQLRPSQRLRLQKTLQFGRLGKILLLSLCDLMPVVKLDHESHIISFQLHTEPLKQGSVNLHSNFGADANLELLEFTIVLLYHVHRCQGPVCSQGQTSTNLLSPGVSQGQTRMIKV